MEAKQGRHESDRTRDSKAQNKHTNITTKTSALICRNAPCKHKGQIAKQDNFTVVIPRCPCIRTFTLALTWQWADSNFEILTNAKPKHNKKIESFVGYRKQALNKYAQNFPICDQTCSKSSSSSQKNSNLWSAWHPKGARLRAETWFPPTSKKKTRSPITKKFPHPYQSISKGDWSTTPSSSSSDVSQSVVTRCRWQKKKKRPLLISASGHPFGIGHCSSIKLTNFTMVVHFNNQAARGNEWNYQS